MPCPQCSGLLQGSRWSYIEFDNRNPEAQLKGKYGVYVVAVRKKGRNLKTITCEVTQLLNHHFGTAWPLVVGEFRTKIVEGRLRLIARNPKCQILYIGRSGKKNGDRDLYTRFREFANGGHVGWPAYWALVLYGWRLRFYYQASRDPKESECRLLRRFAQSHECAPRMPALNKQWPGGCAAPRKVFKGQG